MIISYQELVQQLLSETAKTIDLSTIIKASQTISGEIVLSKLLVRMMKIAMENAGAQNGFIILKDKDCRLS